MATYLSLAEVKAHLRVDFSDDDTYITDLTEMVEELVSAEIGQDLIYLEDAETGLPKALLHAMLLMIGHFYMIREPISIGVLVTKVPYAFDFLIAPFRDYTIV
jgi:hypothetical protein